MKRAFLLTMLPLALLLWSIVPIDVQVRAEVPLRFGVLAYRPMPQVAAKWQPMAAYLESRLGRPVQIAVYDFQGMSDALQRHAVDAVLVNPGFFIRMQNSGQLSAPLVTQVVREGAHQLTSFGGVIFTRAESLSVDSLADLAGRRIAASHTGSLGGYQMQAYELLEAGVPLPAADRLLLVGMPHDRTVEAVLSGRADVGFLRTGVLETMAREGKLQMSRIKVIHRLNLPGFPFASSTRLYPEWPVAVSTKLSEQDTRRLAVALLSLPSQSAAAHAAGIHGFTLPADYDGVEELLRTMRMPPFDRRVEVTVADLWQAYARWIVGFAALFSLLVGIGARLLVQNRRVRQARKQVEELNRSLEERIARSVAELRRKDQMMITQGRQAAMGEMIGNIAHQWRQPLNALALLLANVRDAYRYHELDADYLERSIAEGNRLIQKMSATINDFRNFFDPCKETVAFSARKQIDRAVALVQSSFGNDNISIRLQSACDLDLFGYPNEYSQVLLNLLSNAREAIKESGAPAGSIDIRLDERDGEGCVTVTDNGGGIPADHLDRIFEPYFSTKEMGTGIGLYMSKMIIERNMHGSVEARNVEGGAEFTVRTPLGPASEPEEKDLKAANG
jgi:signal transduction histidine kinase